MEWTKLAQDSCPKAGFGINGLEHSNSATTVSKLDAKIIQTKRRNISWDLAYVNYKCNITKQNNFSDNLLAVRRKYLQDILPAADLPLQSPLKVNITYIGPWPLKGCEPQIPCP